MNQSVIEWLARCGDRHGHKERRISLSLAVRSQGSRKPREKTSCQRPGVVAHTHVLTGKWQDGALHQFLIRTCVVLDFYSCCAHTDTYKRVRFQLDQFSCTHYGQIRSSSLGRPGCDFGGHANMSSVTLLSRTMQIFTLAASLPSIFIHQVASLPAVRSSFIGCK